MNNAIQSWDNDYARLARAAAQLRTTGFSSSPNNNNNAAARQGQASAVESGIHRLVSQLNTLESDLSLTPGEAGRRRTLLEGLHNQITSMDSSGTGGGIPGIGITGGGGTRGGGGRIGGGGESHAAAALRRQDDMIDDLAIGVGRLKDQTHVIHQEANSHVRLLEEMDTNVDIANRGLEEETRRAMKLREEKSVWKLHLIIVGLSVLMFLLILMGLS